MKKWYCGFRGFDKSPFWKYKKPCSCWNWFNEKPGPSYYKERYMYLSWGTNPPLKEIYFSKAQDIFERALEKVKGDKELEQKINILRIPVSFACLLYLGKNHPLSKNAEKHYFPLVEDIIKKDRLLKNNRAKADSLTKIDTLKKMLNKNNK